MKTPVYFDFDAYLFRVLPCKLTPQQRANLRLLQSMLESEFARGFERGRACERMEQAGMSKLPLDKSEINRYAREESKKRGEEAPIK